MIVARVPHIHAGEDTGGGSEPGTGDVERSKDQAFKQQAKRFTGGLLQLAADDQVADIRVAPPLARGEEKAITSQPGEENIRRPRFTTGRYCIPLSR